jgi:hypothetical protein
MIKILKAHDQNPQTPRLGAFLQEKTVLDTQFQ